MHRRREAEDIDMAMIEVSVLPRGRALVNVTQILYVLASDAATRIHFRDGSVLDVRHKLSEIQELIDRQSGA